MSIEHGLNTAWVGGLCCVSQCCCHTRVHATRSARAEVIDGNKLCFETKNEDEEHDDDDMPSDNDLAALSAAPRLDTTAESLQLAFLGDPRYSIRQGSRPCFRHCGS
jgi:hypothetical protein